VASSVTVPLWVAIAVAVLAVVALIDRLFSPALGWWLRRRANRAIDELNQRLRLKIPPFKLARRSRLIEQLMFDPDILKAVEDEAKERGEPKSVTHARARRYAKEIIPSFSAYAYFRVGTRLARLATQMMRRRMRRLTFSAAGWGWLHCSRPCSSCFVKETGRKSQVR
jgi:glycerol-3-phosphate O-acyltransferase